MRSRLGSAEEAASDSTNGKLVQESALKRNLLKRPKEQRIYVETWRVRCANAPNISLVIEVTARNLRGESQHSLSNW